MGRLRATFTKDRSEMGTIFLEFDYPKSECRAHLRRGLSLTMLLK